MLRHVIEYCAAHEVAEDEAATVVEHGRDTGLMLAGPGAPCVSEFAVVELAAALGMTVDACRRYVGQVLEVHYRLPLIWRRVAAGDLQWWRAARIAQHTMLLPAAGAGACGPAAGGGGAQGRGGPHREALPGGPRPASTPTEAEARRQAAAEARHVDVPTRDRAGRHGTVEVTPRRSTWPTPSTSRPRSPRPPAELEAGGSTDILDVRRSMALGVIARHYLGDAPQRRPRRCRAAGQTPPGRHQRAPAGPGHRPLRHHKGADLGGTSEVVVHPPGHPDHHQARSATSTSTSGSTPYEVPDRLADQVTERDGTCVHPWCTRPARSCDKDHCKPYDRGGTNLHRQHRAAVSNASSRQDPRRMELPVPADPAPTCGASPDGLLVPPRRHRHHRPRTTRS